MLIITYFDDELLFKIAISKFIEKIESHIWSREQINEYCDLNEEIMPIKQIVKVIKQKRLIKFL